MTARQTDVLNALRFAADYLSNPERWTREAFVRFVDGTPGEPWDVREPGIVQADIIGALRLSDASIDARMAALTAVAIAINPEWSPCAQSTIGLDSGVAVITFNDCPQTTHADVLRVLRKAIADVEVSAAVVARWEAGP